MTIEVSTNVNPIVNLQVSTTDPQNPTVDVDVPEAVVVGVDTTVLLGPKGDPGFSPIANVTKSGSTATITITDEIGTTTASISDGAKGDTGDSGVRISTTEPTDPVVNVWINPNGSETQYVEDVKVNGSTVVTDKVAEITMPTKVSDLTNDSNFQTGSQVTTAITSKTQPIESTITTMQTSMTSLGSTVTTMQTTMSSYGDVVTHNANEFYASNNPKNYQTGSQVTTAITSETNPIKSTVTTMQTTITNISSTVTTMQTTMSNYGDVVTHDADEFYLATNPSGYQTSTQVTSAVTSYHDDTKQNTLVSGTNIKTINNESILGSGNIEIRGGGGFIVDLDGGNSLSTYIMEQNVDGGSANSVYTQSRTIDGGNSVQEE